VKVSTGSTTVDSARQGSTDVRAVGARISKLSKTFLARLGLARLPPPRPRAVYLMEGCGPQFCLPASLDPSGHQLRPPDFSPFAGLINATSGPLPLLAQLMGQLYLPTSARCCKPRPQFLLFLAVMPPLG
jgi:hypothetical protein